MGAMKSWLLLIGGLALAACLGALLIVIIRWSRMNNLERVYADIRAMDKARANGKQKTL